MRGHPGAGVNKQVAADGAGVGDLALTDRGGAHSSPCLAQLVDLVHDAAQVTGTVLVQAGCHGQRDGGGRYSYIWWGVCVRELPGPVSSRWGLLEVTGHGRSSCSHSLGKGLRANESLGVLHAGKLGCIRHEAQILSHSLLS